MKKIDMIFTYLDISKNVQIQKQCFVWVIWKDSFYKGTKLQKKGLHFPLSRSLCPLKVGLCIKTTVSDIIARIQFFKFGLNKNLCLLVPCLILQGDSVQANGHWRQAEESVLSNAHLRVVVGKQELDKRQLKLCGSQQSFMSLKKSSKEQYLENQ